MSTCDDYIRKLTAAYPCIRTVWLFGSRANGSERPDSDWDLLVFSDDDRLLNLLAQDRRFDRPDFDLFVVATSNAFTRPWPDADGTFRKGYLDATALGWKWRELSASEAQYEERKAANPAYPSGWRTITQDRRAACIFRRAMARPLAIPLFRG